MTAGTRTLQPADGEGLDADRVVAALGRRFTVAPGPRRAVTRTHVDTFDRRLRAAGLGLEHDVTARRQALVLTRADGPGATAAATGLRWPAFPDALPDGVLRQAVAAPAGIRALTAVGQEKRRLQLVELRNADDKIVVRVELDEPDEGEPARPPTVTVRELRGYADEAAQAIKALVAAGLRPAPDPVPVDDDQGRTPVADRQQPAALLLTAALGGFATALDDNLPGLLDDVDTEFLHDFRVAVRRTRATLKIGRPALPDSMHADWEPAFKWLGDLTTPVRDLDVYELELPMMGSWLVAADAADLAAFATHLGRRRTAARRTLVRGLRSQRYRRLRAGWDLALDQLGGEAANPGGPTAGDLADQAIRRAARRVLRGGRSVAADSAATDLHDLRKRCKELRYALEVFAPVIDSAIRKKVVGDLKDLQDVLGRFQDTEVQRRALRSFAEEMMADGTSAEAVLAMGELIGHLDAEQDRARAEFDTAFATFARPAGVQRLLHLGGHR
jgi:CHAD domain-containing protein